jgi:flagellar hook-basal body complex protein FliE
MKITPIGTAPAAQPATRPIQDSRPGFKESLLETIDKVNDLQSKAHTAMEELATGQSSNLHEAMIAIQKAEISFKMLMQVRNKIVSAYQEIMRMPV